MRHLWVALNRWWVAYPLHNEISPPATTEGGALVIAWETPRKTADEIAADDTLRATLHEVGP